MASTCAKHTDVPSTGRCEQCHRQMCVDCTSSAFVMLTCRDCAEEKIAQKKKGRMLLAAALVPVVIGLGYGFVQLASTFTPAAQAERKAKERAAVAEAEANAEAEALLQRLRAQPCSRQVVIPTLEGLLKSQRADVVLTEAARFEKECGRWPRLWWTTYAAYEQRGEFQAAAAEATKLIDDNPDDRDFWWWRARAYFNAGAFDKAEPDYRRVPARRASWAGPPPTRSRSSSGRATPSRPSCSRS